MIQFIGKISLRAIESVWNMLLAGNATAVPDVLISVGVVSSMCKVAWSLTSNLGPSLTLT